MQLKLEAVTEFVQRHLGDGLVLIVGSGLSAAEGIPGMQQLTEHLRAKSTTLSKPDHDLWRQIDAKLGVGHGLEDALHAHPPTDTLQEWIVGRTCELLVPSERSVIAKVLRAEKRLRLTPFLERLLSQPGGIPIVTTNYDRLIEVACEMAGLHVDTTAIGQYAGKFDPERSLMASCRAIVKRGKYQSLEHFPRAVVLKPHGSFDWYRSANGPRRCSLDLDAARMIITPGLNKYRAGYDMPFDRHRELANAHISRAARLAIVGYGFNDDHLQHHLEARIRAGVPTLILTRTASLRARELASSSGSCFCLSSLATGQGVHVMTKGAAADFPGDDLWDLEVLTTRMLT